MNDIWHGFLSWAESWDSSQGFWVAIQSIGTLVAASAALIAVVIARHQLGQLIESNKLLSDSNEAMTASNVAATRPYVTVDFDFRPVLRRSGGTHTVSLAVKIENIGRSPAKDLTLSLDQPLTIQAGTRTREDFAESVSALNRLMNGVTVIKTLSPLRPLVYYIGDASGVKNGAGAPGAAWTITAAYNDASGESFTELFHLELEHWKLAIVSTDPLHRIAKNLENLSHELNNHQPPRVIAEFEASSKYRIGRPRPRRFGKRRAA